MNEPENPSHMSASNAEMACEMTSQLRMHNIGRLKTSEDRKKIRSK